MATQRPDEFFDPKGDDAERLLDNIPQERLDDLIFVGPEDEQPSELETMLQEARTQSLAIFSQLEDQDTDGDPA